jgi:type II secretion system protein H
LAVKRAHKEAGFTLVEILCVLALLGLTAGLVVLNLPKPAPAFKTDVQSVVTLLNLSARQSVIDGKSRAIDLTTGRIDILYYDGEWVADHQRDFTNVYGLNLTVEDQPIDLADRDKRREKAELPPLIYFDATGNVTPFELEINGRAESYILSPDARGRIILETAP